MPVLEADDVMALQEEADRVRADESVLDYIMALVAATRPSPLLSLGVSPRGSLALLRAARAQALADGRDYLVPDDVKSLAVPAARPPRHGQGPRRAGRRHGRRSGAALDRPGRSRPALSAAPLS